MTSTDVSYREKSSCFTRFLCSETHADSQCQSICFSSDRFSHRSLHTSSEVQRTRVFHKACLMAAVSTRYKTLTEPARNGFIELCSDIAFVLSLVFHTSLETSIYRASTSYPFLLRLTMLLSSHVRTIGSAVTYLQLFSRSEAQSFLLKSIDVPLRCQRHFSDTLPL